MMATTESAKVGTGRLLRPEQKPYPLLQKLFSASSRARDPDVDLSTGNLSSSAASFTEPLRRVFVQCDTDPERFPVPKEAVVSRAANASLAAKVDSELTEEASNVSVQLEPLVPEAETANLCGLREMSCRCTNAQIYVRFLFYSRSVIVPCLLHHIVSVHCSSGLSRIRA